MSRLLWERLPFLVALGAIILPTLLFTIGLRREFYVHTSDGIVIISGTSTGIGREACSYLAERHSKITFYCGVRKETDGISGHPFTTLENVVPVILDVTKDEDVDSVISKVQESGKPLVAVFNNAGVNKLGTIEFQDLDVYRWHFDVHLFGTYRLTQAALPLLRQAKGRVIVMGSIMGRSSAPVRMAAYSGAKHAQEAFGDALRKEVEHHGVSVSLIEPGFLRTKLIDKVERDERDFLQADGEEMKTYPNLYNEAKMKVAIAMLSMVGEIEETCEAIADAMFGKFPKTRYVTSVVGPLPSWLFLRILEIIPDRMADILLKNVRLLGLFGGFVKNKMLGRKIQ
jgi:NAD(P)-dependent dehydrogenase (short-subunit alcohol dehydrogenase family)